MRIAWMVLPVVFLAWGCGKDPHSNHPSGGSTDGDLTSGQGATMGPSASSGSGTTQGANAQGAAGTTRGTPSDGSGTGGSGSGTGGSGSGTGGSGSMPKVDLEVCPEGTTCECDDGIDNDGDGLVDWHFDLGCTARNDSTEAGDSGSLEGGWTVFEPSSDTRIVYASEEGNDDWDGLAPEFESGQRGPKRTLRAGLQELRSGNPDWLLLRRGDSFDAADFNVSGRSATEPIVISSYGTDLAQPTISDAEVNYSAENVAIVNLRFVSTLVAFIDDASNLTLEGCTLEGSSSQLVSSEGIAGKRQNLNIRRNVSLNVSTPFYFASVNGLLIEENVLYRPNQSGGDHGMYIQYVEGDGNVVTRGNLVYFDQGGGDGIKQRPGGVSEENIISGADLSSINFEGTIAMNGVARGNLIVQRRTPYSPGVSFSGGWSGEATDNIVADEPDGIDAPPVAAGGSITQSGNIQVLTPGDSDRPDATMLGLYSADQLDGEATTEAFFEAASQQRKFQFRPELTASAVIQYVRDNYLK